MVIAIIVIALIVLLGLIYILVRNSMVASRNRVDEAWSGIDVQLKRRHDLVPNLVETVKGYAQHERETFEKVTQARAAAMAAQGPAQASQAESALTAALGGLRVVAEQYPTLRATENFQQLSRNLSELEDEIQASRRIYNSNVQAYNTKIQIFPNSLIANSGGFTPREFFEITDAAEREPVAVSFSQPPDGASAQAPPPAPAAPSQEPPPAPAQPQQ
ncbi:MAG: LemA family protein [Solirubrobacterales bacterium]